MPNSIVTKRCLPKTMRMSYSVGLDASGNLEFSEWARLSEDMLNCATAKVFQSFFLELDLDAEYIRIPQYICDVFGIFFFSEQCVT